MLKKIRHLLVIYYKLSINFKFLIPTIQNFCSYMSKVVRIRGIFFSKQTGFREQKSFGNSVLKC